MKRIVNERDGLVEMELPPKSSPPLRGGTSRAPCMAP
jgi:hypothetical protein